VWNYPGPFAGRGVFSSRDAGAGQPEDTAMAYAIFKTGGKQYKVSVGDKLDVEKLPVTEGEWATFDQVLAHGEGADIKVGSPTVSGATVVAKVVKQHRAPKVTAFKFKKRKGYHLTKGHRQQITRVQIVSINA
jgi:large subunit ribosomal protein L21